MTGPLKFIEKWASQNDDRMRLVVICIWLAFAVLVLGGTFVAAELILPPQWRPF